MSQPWTHTAYAPAYPRIDEWYIEPAWVSERLFKEEPFQGAIYDPCCGMGRIVTSALAVGYEAYGSDIADRGWDSTPQNFFTFSSLHKNIVCNPPFKDLERFAKHALSRTTRKVAMICPTARLNAARWLEHTPLCRIWLLTPRPSMPPGNHVLDGGKIGGGKSDYCWLVWDHTYKGTAELKWLHRDGAKAHDRQDNSSR